MKRSTEHIPFSDDDGDLWVDDAPAQSSTRLLAERGREVGEGEKLVKPAKSSTRPSETRLLASSDPAPQEPRAQKPVKTEKRRQKKRSRTHLLVRGERMGFGVIRAVKPPKLQAQKKAQKRIRRSKTKILAQRGAEA